MHPTRFSKTRYLLVIVLILFIYLLDSSLAKMVSESDYFYSLIRPLLWCGIALLVWFFPAVRPAGKLRTRGSLNFWAFNFAVIMIAVQFVAGLIDGLGKSPYNHSLTGIVSNILIVGTALIGREFARSYLVNGKTRVESYRIFILVALFLTIVSFPIAKYTGFTSYEEIVKFIAQYLAPEFTKNLLATVLVFYGGAMSSILFMGTLEAFQWLSPILPDLKWITAALIGILVPVFLLSFAEIIYADEEKIRRRKDKTDENPWSWMATALVSIGIIWFAVGVFPIYPSVIATGSMIPMIQPGDVILVDKSVDASQLEKGQVIQFKRDNILISHRIIDVVEMEGEKSYRTQGDNNRGSDSELVKPQDIKGKIIQVVPKIGWPTLLIKSQKETPLNDVRF